MCNGLITMRLLGNYGRWGNLLFEYSFIRAYAKMHGLDYQVPRWIGQHVFGFDDPPVTTILSQTRERYVNQPPFNPPLAPAGAEFCDRDFEGWAQFHTSWYWPHRDYLRGLFSNLTAKAKARVDEPLQCLRAKGKTLIGLQIRRGDYGREIFYRTPVAWFNAWLERHLKRFNNPAIFVACEDMKSVSTLPASFATVNSLGVPPPDAEYTDLLHELERKNIPSLDPFPAWYLLSQCDVLLISNSSYGFTAGMFGNAKECWRSNLPGQTFIPFNPWWDQPMEYSSLRDWPDIPETSCATNPYW